MIDFFFPKMCVCCSKPGSFLCDSCAAKKLCLIYEQQCHVCRQISRKYSVHFDCKHLTNLDGVYVCYAYSDAIESLLALAKYQFYFSVLDRIAELMAVQLPAGYLGRKAVSWVPAGKWKQKWRGFSHTKILATKLVGQGGGQAVRLLDKSGHRPSQMGSNREQRLINLKGTINYVGPVGPPEEVVLVDDVMTTGATLEECALVLKRSGVKKVYGLVFARGS